MKGLKESRPAKGFTLLELVIVLAVMATLAGVLVPIVKQVLDSAKVSKLTSLVDSLSNACKRYYKDTRGFAKEYGYSSLADEHQLAYDQTDPLKVAVPVKDWNGPYIEGPLLDSMLPFEGAQIQLLGTLQGAGAGYFLAGSSGPNTKGNLGQEINLGPLPLKWAEKINAAFDGTGENAPPVEGRVIYADEGGGNYQVYIFVLDPFGSH